MLTRESPRLNPPNADLQIDGFPILRGPVQGEGSSRYSTIAAISASLRLSCGIAVVGPPPSHAGERKAPGSRTDSAMYASAVSPARRSLAQAGASAREGNSSKLAWPSGPSWHVAHPLARN